ncbi:MAG: hypothetical protein C0169_00040 [Thermodesulfobacterium geofontis]|uniref:CRISPR type III-associated protein domain-containing protein n=1 Tax=Thermodesulfobacterium geofontis TaxID=1295609 RepID=A0A2N7QGX5_9BACT|nr:MAG: hypothetical protein C0169_00040 [Thermodesulfobacterium geofontis]
MSYLEDKVTINIEFNTITPLWTGDAWRESKAIRPSSLIGSLRFWFETLMYLGGILNEHDFDKNLGRFEKNINSEKFKKYLMENVNSYVSKVQALLQQDIPISSIIFGTTGCRSLIEIKSIKELDDYCYGNKLRLPNKICVAKNSNEVKEGDKCPKSSDQQYSVFYLPKHYFYGKFEVVFEVDKEILCPIFCPLLTFMDKYGFWGGKWNLGYGRLKIEEIKIEEIKESNNGKTNWKKEEFDLSKFNKGNGGAGNLKFCDLIKDASVFEFSEQDSKAKIIKIFKPKNNNPENLKEVIKELIRIKAKKRAETKNQSYNVSQKEYKKYQKYRHYLFGKTGKIDDEDLPQGSKILPFIEKNNGNYVGGFLSIAGLLNLYGRG